MLPDCPDLNAKEKLHRAAGLLTTQSVGPCYLGIDPGNDKAGLALVDAAGRIVAVRVVKATGLTGRAEKFVRETLQTPNFWALRAALAGIVMGDGTNSQKQRQQIQDSFTGIPFHLVDESYTTEEARALYWQLHPPQGWRRLIPLGLRVPSEPLDGLAAVIQVRRYLEQKKA